MEMLTVAVGVSSGLCSIKDFESKKEETQPPLFQLGVGE